MPWVFLSALFTSFSNVFLIIFKWDIILSLSSGLKSGTIHKLSKLDRLDKLTHEELLDISVSDPVLEGDDDEELEAL